MAVRVAATLLAALLVHPALCPAEPEWQPAPGRLMTRWAAELSPDEVHPEYPRPQLARKEWVNLNGLWDYAVSSRDADRPEAFEGKILVPFPIESALSGVMRRVGPDQRVWYRRTFTIPGGWRAPRVALNFGAVDWDAVVYVDGQAVGSHRGGYDPFSVAIDGAMARGGEHELMVAVWDPTDTGSQPRGKQVTEPRGIWYTPSTGIWQTVWMEPLGDAAVRSLRIVPDLAAAAVRVSVSADAAGAGLRASITVRDGRRKLGSSAGTLGESIAIPIRSPRLWTPESPHLYQLEVALERGRDELDRVTSYFGMREVSVSNDADGGTRLLLNGEPYFMFGPLDQGFWPDGLYTAPSDEALRYDIEVTKRLGYNTIRKHVKVEPARWYYWTDKLGVLVWQDMPNGGPHAAAGAGEIERDPESAGQFERELESVVEALANHPSIVMWVPFNEGWGQYDTERIVERVRGLDPTRLIDCASGWNDYPVGDVLDYHSYPGPVALATEPPRASVLGEFGGLGLPLAGHTWQDEENWGYRHYEDPGALNTAYVELLDRLRPMRHTPGVAAAIYTQTTDVEIEVNGFMTYDRTVIKLDQPRVLAAHRRLYGAPPRVRVLAATSEHDPQRWAYATSEPGAGWERTGFDDSRWRRGDGGLGMGARGAVARTALGGPVVWARREVPLESADATHLIVQHQGETEVYLNGVLAARLEGRANGYTYAPISESARAALVAGRNAIAVRCRDDRRGPSVDVGLAAIDEAGGR